MFCGPQALKVWDTYFNTKSNFILVRNIFKRIDCRQKFNENANQLFFLDVPDRIL